MLHVQGSIYIKIWLFNRSEIHWSDKEPRTSIDGFIQNYKEFYWVWKNIQRIRGKVHIYICILFSRTSLEIVVTSLNEFVITLSFGLCYACGEISQLFRKSMNNCILAFSFALYALTSFACVMIICVFLMAIKFSRFTWFCMDLDDYMVETAKPRGAMSPPPTFRLRWSFLRRSRVVGLPNPAKLLKLQLKMRCPGSRIFELLVFKISQGLPPEPL